MYKRTVHCRYCGASGHNRAGCEKHKEYAKNNPDSWAARNVENRKEKAKNRECSYCHTVGHNRATCTILGTDRVKAIITNRKFRKETLAKFQEYGIGLGTLIEYSPAWHYGNQQPILMVVEEIRWDNILYQNKASSIIVNVNGETDIYQSFTPDDSFWSLLGSKNINIIAKAQPECIGIGITKEWTSGISGIKNAFHDF